MHSIRLHGPWKLEVLECYSGSAAVVLGSQFNCTIPCDWGQWLGNEFRGRVAYGRSFGCPASLDLSERVVLVVEQVDFRAEIWLGDKYLGQAELGMPPQRYDIKELLRPRNRLRLEIDLPLDANREARDRLAGGLIGSVRLEIG